MPANLSVKRLVLLFSFGVAIAPFWFPFWPHYQHLPTLDVRAFTPSLLHGLGYALWLSGLMMGCWLISQQLKNLRLIWAGGVLFILLLIPTYPVNATDVYRYLIRARVMTVHGQNQFETPPATFVDDPLLPFAGEWAEETTPYGPVWEGVMVGITAVTNKITTPLQWGLLATKAFLGVVHLACGWLIYQLAILLKKDAPQALVLWLWNPLLLSAFVIDAHNDVLMLFWLLCGWWIWQKREERPNGRFATSLLALSIMGLAPLTKLIGLFALPPFLLAFWQEQDWRGRVKGTAVLSLIALTLISLVFLPFGSPLALIQRLLREAGDGGSFSITVLLIILNNQWGWNISFANWVWLTRMAAIIGAVWVAWQSWHKRLPPAVGAASLFALYIVQALNFRIWYSSWLFPFLLLGTDKQRRLGIWFLLTAHLSVIVYGHIRVYLLARDQYIAHMIGVPFVFLLPFLASYLKRPK